MGFNPGKIIGNTIGGVLSPIANILSPKVKATAAPATSSDATQTRDAATQAATAAMLARGLTPLAATSPLGDTTLANIGKKRTLGGS